MAVKSIHPKNINETLTKRLHPTVVMWNRLEGRPRTHHFDKALKGEVRDALWMLTKQWQMGEFKADDAGSPVSSKVHIITSQLNQFKPGNQNYQVMSDSIPLEAQVEQKRIPFKRNQVNISLDLRLQMGRYWLKLLLNASLDYRIAYVQKYSFEIPLQSRNTDYLYAHKDELQQLKAVAGRCVDGYELYEAIESSGSASQGITLTDPGHGAMLDNLGLVFQKWFRKNYWQPSDENNHAWLPDRLEYKFECKAESAEGTNLLTAEEYYHGHLDWYAFNQESGQNPVNSIQPSVFTDSFIPTHVAFEGMPDSRWWKFEDSKTSFGDIKPSTTDLAKLLLIEFGLVFANDWFLIPFRLPIGSLSEIKGLIVDNNFGETFWIESAERSNHANLEWSMFKVHSNTFSEKMLLAPSAIKVQEGEPMEEIMLIRDEMANMVWGIEKTISSISGKGVKGGEYALQTKKYHDMAVHLAGELLFYKEFLEAEISNHTAPLSVELAALKTELEDEINRVKFLNAAMEPSTDLIKKVKLILVSNQLKAEFLKPGDTDYTAKISYHAMTSVPENWIPFVPVHTSGHKRKTQLQRASMLRLIEGDKINPVKIKPQTSILRNGLDPLQNSQPYLIHEEEIPRAGTKVIQSFQRTRWINGEIYVWLGMKKKTDRGEGSSGLGFDQIKNV